jgi:hypothetical protein
MKWDFQKYLIRSLQGKVLSYRGFFIFMLKKIKKEERTMISKKACLLTILVIFGFTGCATTTKDKLDFSWMNAPRDKLIAEWGPPSHALVKINNWQEYTWLHIGNTVVKPDDYYSQLKMVSNNPKTEWCKTRVFVNPTDRIYDWLSEGPSCLPK